MIGASARAIVVVAISSLTGCWSIYHSPREVSSGQIGCPASEIEVSGEQSGEVSLQRTWVATCRGRTYYCVEVTGQGKSNSAQVTCTRDADEARAERDSASSAPASAPASLAAPPVGAVGFTLGASAADSEQVCTGAGLQWKKGKEVFHCSGLPKAAGFGGRAQLTFCADKLCKLTLLADSGATTVRDDYARLRAALTGKYGAPTEAVDLVPSECEDRIADCLDDAEAAVSAQWLWPNGTYLMVEITPVAHKAQLLVVYEQGKAGGPTEPIRADQL